MIAPIGYFRLWRELYTKPIWIQSTPEQKVVLFTLLAMANFKENEWEWSGEKFKVNKGQFVTSLESIKVASGKGVSIQNVRSSLKRFEKLGFLTNKSTKQGRLITILNWALYQPKEDKPNKANDKDPTKGQQRINKDPTPKEEGNKGNNEKKKEEEYSDYVSLFLKTFKGKKNKKPRDNKLPKILEKHGSEELHRATERYIDECNRLDRFIMNEQTWWNGRYIDYLDENYEHMESPKEKKKPMDAKTKRNADGTDWIFENMG